MSDKDQPTPRPELPTNIESATREHVRDNLASWDAEILERRANRLGVPVDEAARIESKPLFVIEAERQAQAENRTVESVLRDYAVRVQSSTYPGPECFLPDEIAEYVEGILPSERLKHAEACSGCKVLLAGSFPPEDAASKLLADFEARSRLIKPPADLNVRGVIPAADLSRYRAALLKSWVAAVLPPAILLPGMYLTLSSLDKDATKLTSLSSSLPWVVALVTAAATLAIFERYRGSRPMRSLAAGISGALVLGAFFLVDFHQARSNRDLAVLYARDRFESLCLSSLLHQEQTGKFGRIEQGLGPFRIETQRIDQQGAIYFATLRELPGKMVFVATTDGCTVEWNDGKRLQHLLIIHAGSAIRTSQGLRLHLANGQTYPMSEDEDLNYVSSGVRVLATMDPNTESVASVSLMPKVPEWQLNSDPKTHTQRAPRTH